MTAVVPSVGSLRLANLLFRRFPYVTGVTGSLYVARKGSSGLAGTLSETGELCGWRESCRGQPRPAHRVR